MPDKSFIKPIQLRYVVHKLFAGEGDLDIPLIADCLTGVTEYYGVDTRKSAVDIMQKKLSEFNNRTFQVIPTK